jgi:hypothetical protein
LVDALWVDALDDQQPAVRAHRAMAVPEDRESQLVVPVVDDVLQDVGVMGARHGLEEASPDRLASLGEPALGDLLLGSLDDVGLVEDRPAKMGMRLQDAE